MDEEPISKNSQLSMFNFLRNSTEDKIKKARYIFFVNIIGNYYSAGGAFYRDCSKNRGMIYLEKLYKNNNDRFAIGRVLQIRDFYDEYILDQKDIKSIRDEQVEEVAYGKKIIKSYVEKHDLSDIPQIYKLELN